MSYNFKSKKIIISAGATGIGWATAKESLEKGAKVFLCDIDQKSINKLKKITTRFHQLLLMNQKLITLYHSKIFQIY